MPSKLLRVPIVPFSSQPGPEMMSLDVFDDYGYSGCKWINQTKFLRSEGDRKVAEWPTKQRQRVQEGLDLKVHEKVLDVFLLGRNGFF